MVSVIRLEYIEKSWFKSRDAPLFPIPALLSNFFKAEVPVPALVPFGRTLLHLSGSPGWGDNDLVTGLPGRRC